MKVYKFICPGCSRVYRITAQSDDTPTDDFKCRCGFKAPLSTVLSWSNEISGGNKEEKKEEKKPDNVEHLPTQIKGQKTVLGNAGLPTNVTTQTATLYLVPQNGEPPILLKPGKYTVGRRSSDSTAALKLTSDRAMSRVHAEVHIITDIKCYIRSLNVNNPVLLNNKPLPVELFSEFSINDRLQLGNSIFVVTKK